MTEILGSSDKDFKVAITKQLSKQLQKFLKQMRKMGSPNKEIEDIKENQGELGGSAS